MSGKTFSGLKAYAAGLSEVCGRLPFRDIQAMVDILWEAVRSGRVIYTMGNGGRASTASHMINDICKHTVSSDDKKTVVSGHRRFRTICLNDSMSLLTGIANDMGYDAVFSEQLANWVQAGDVVGISGSGNSRNVLDAFRVAKEKGARTICLTGFDGGRARGEADVCVAVPLEKMVMVEDVHLMISHMVADELKKRVQKRKNLRG